MFTSSFIDAVAVGNHDASYFCLTLDSKRVFDAVLVSFVCIRMLEWPQRVSLSSVFAIQFAMAMLTTAVGPGYPPLVLTGLGHFLISIHEMQNMIEHHRTLAKCRAGSHSLSLIQSRETSSLIRKFRWLRHQP